MGTALQRRKPFATRRPALFLKKNSPLLLKLVQIFHSSLDVNILIKKFSQQLNKLINYDVLYYFHPEEDIAIKFGHGKKPADFSHPLKFKHLSLGRIELGRNIGFNIVEERNLKKLIQFLLPALKNAVIYHHTLYASLHDPLTHLANRTALDLALTKLIKLMINHKTPLAIMAVDLDNFKQVNDNYGHHRGDEILQLFTQNLQSSVRDSDMVFRTGGEEFTVLLPNTDLKGALRLAKRTCKTIASHIFYQNDKPFSITASIGVADYKGKENSEILLNKADKALYRAKRRGKDRAST